MSRVTFIINLSFVIILSDVLLNYFLKIYFHRLPVLASIPALLLLYILFNAKEVRKVRANYILCIFLGFLGYSTGLVTIDNVPTNRMAEIFTAFCAWIVGYLWIVKNDTKSDNWNSVLVVTVIHAAVCVIALTKISPSYFPIGEYLWSLNGTLISRPEVTTDQNFQIFYFLPLIGLLFFYKNIGQAVIALVGLILASYTISSLQTRSGILVLFGTLCLGLFLNIVCRGGQKTRALMISGLLLIFVVSVVIYKFETIRLLVIRFTHENFETGYGRLHGFLYFFDKIWNPFWWVPRGNADYIKVSHGQIPHSNITAQLMDGGILGVIAWFTLIVIPGIKLLFLQIRKNLNRDSAIVIILSLGSLVVQLTLNVPFMDIVWLYGGASAGALYKLQKSTSTNR